MLAGLGRRARDVARPSLKDVPLDVRARRAEVVVHDHVEDRVRPREPLVRRLCFAVRDLDEWEGRFIFTRILLHFYNPMGAFCAKSYIRAFYPNS